ncbi:MAG TPA: hypothetical protein PLX20_01965 [Rhodocyclaceae bacterium]|nr:hypothetical protein [Accumulibacter sp.]HNF91172.1 hypothetical protein [Accumulibacter sp.]HNH11868.1 hypothetical protein [Rhodocyclaceae bacterium]
MAFPEASWILGFKYLGLETRMVRRFWGVMLEDSQSMRLSGIRKTLPPRRPQGVMQITAGASPRGYPAQHCHCAGTPTANAGAIFGTCMDWLHVALSRLYGLLSHPFETLFSRSSAELATSIAIALVLGVIGLLAARRFRG